MPGSVKGTNFKFEHFAHIAQLAERAKMDAMFFADANMVQPTDLIEKGDPVAARFPRAVGLEALSLLPALAAVTTRIGLIATGTTTYNEPYTIARRFATLDQISGGRGGWNLVTSQHENEAQNFGFDQHMEHDERYRRAHEFFDVVCGLWDGWDEDAVIEDKDSAVYFDVAKAHVLNHSGKYFKVRGPLNVPRSPQGGQLLRKPARQVSDAIWRHESRIAYFPPVRAWRKAGHLRAIFASAQWNTAASPKT